VVGNGPTNATDPSGLEEKDAVPQLIVNEKPLTNKPVIGPNGSFVWLAQFKLSKKTQKGGWIIQEIKIKRTYFDKDNKDITAEVAKTLTAPDNATLAKKQTFLSGYWYWEAWEVEKNSDVPGGGDFISVNDIDATRITLSGMATQLEKAKKDQDDNYKSIKQLIANCTADAKLPRAERTTIGKVSDTFSASSDFDNPTKYAKMTIEYYAKVFFVEDPVLPPGFARPNSPLRNPDLNENPAGELRNLSIVYEVVNKDVKPTAETKAVIDWITKNGEVKNRSNLVFRYFVLTSDPSVDMGIPTIDKAYEGPIDPKPMPKK
jgi:hypothetical protein